MRSDLGFATIGQRLAGLANIGQQARSDAAASTAAPAAPAGGQDFAQTLQAQLTGPVTDNRPGVAAPALPTGQPTGQPAGSWLDQAQASRPLTLGPGVSLHGGQSVITPAAPGTSLDDVFGVGHSGGACCPTHAEQMLQAAGGGHVHEVREPPALDREGPPPELVAYGNGQIPAEALEPLGIEDHSLWAPAARAFRDLHAAAAAEGIDIGITDSYRSYERQVEMVERYGLYSQGGLAASPGTSNHGWGLSLDLDLDDQAQAWMRENAANYGFVEDVPREPWHWTFKASDY